MTLLLFRGVRLPVVGSKLISQRLEAVADLVLKKEYDIVVFQEVTYIVIVTAKCFIIYYAALYFFIYYVYYYSILLFILIIIGERRNLVRSEHPTPNRLAQLCE